MRRISILQIGGTDFNSKYQIPKYLTLTFCEEVEIKPEAAYDLVIINREINEKDYQSLLKICKPYHVFVTAKVKSVLGTKRLMDRMMGQQFQSEQEIQEFLTNKAKYYYKKTLIDILNPLDLAISRNYRGKVSYNGGHNVILDGDYGEKNQIAFYRKMVPVNAGEAYDIWFEYEKEDSVCLSLVVMLFSGDSISQITKRWEFSEKDMEKIVTVQNENEQGHFFFSVNASGNGKVRIKDVHYRLSRNGIGSFLPGDCRVVTRNREEIFYYFEPGNGKAPLHILFSDYDAKNGFDGLKEMRDLGHPFLLISEHRLGGGAFYLGEGEYEGQIKQIITQKMKELNFSKEQVLMSGISMGAFGAMYYACDIEPFGVILGRPLLSIGDVARNERLIRPGVWPYPMDVLLMLMGDLSKESSEKLNDRLWNKYKNKKFAKTRFAVAYMLEDDFDRTAYDRMLENVSGEEAFIYGTGFHGRHNDEKKNVLNWFFNQFHRMIQEDF